MKKIVIGVLLFGSLLPSIGYGQSATVPQNRQRTDKAQGYTFTQRRLRVGDRFKDVSVFRFGRSDVIFSSSHTGKRLGTGKFSQLVTLEAEVTVIKLNEQGDVHKLKIDVLSSKSTLELSSLNGAPPLGQDSINDETYFALDKKQFIIEKWSDTQIHVDEVVRIGKKSELKGCSKKVTDKLIENFGRYFEVKNCSKASLIPNRAIKIGEAFSADKQALKASILKYARSISNVKLASCKMKLVRIVEVEGQKCGEFQVQEFYDLDLSGIQFKSWSRSKIYVTLSGKFVTKVTSTGNYVLDWDSIPDSRIKCFGPQFAESKLTFIPAKKQ